MSDCCCSIESSLPTVHPSLLQSIPVTDYKDVQNRASAASGGRNSEDQPSCVTVGLVALVQLKYVLNVQTVFAWVKHSMKFIEDSE